MGESWVALECSLLFSSGWSQSEHSVPHPFNPAGFLSSVV